MTESPALAGFRRTVVDLVRARFPVLYVETVEEERLVDTLRDVVADARLARQRLRLVTWRLTTGLHDESQSWPRTAELPQALAAIAAYDEPGLFVIFDVHWFLRPQRGLAEQRVIRQLRDLRASLTRGGATKTVVFVAPQLVLPTELEKDVYIVDFPLPGVAELGEVLDRIIDDNRGRLAVDLDRAGRERLVSAALGLTVQEAENAFARGAVRDQRLDLDDIALVMEEKRQAIRKSTLLEYVAPTSGFDDIGGLDQLKQWMRRRSGAWTESARAFGLPFPRGALITGVPGCGKSLTARCTSALWGLPLLRLDIGRVFAGLVGSSEQNMRSAIRTAEALAPCILWIDEIEKGFGQGGRQGLDGGTSSRVFGSFLTWMQEKEQPVFVIATANDISVLPPEFLRKGRFDEIFFVDLPTPRERAEVFEIHLRSYLRSREASLDFPLTGETFVRLASAANEFSGAEIEQAVVAAMFVAYEAGRPVRVTDVETALRHTVPLAVTQAEQVQMLRAWADQRAVGATHHEELAGLIGRTGLDGSGLRRGGRVLDVMEVP